MIKKVGIGLVVVVIAAIAALPFVLNPLVTRYRPEIEKTVSSAAGVDVKFGSLSASAFPSAGIEIEGLTINGVPPEDASLKKLILRTSMLSLIRGHIQVEKFELDSPSFKVTKLKDGTFRVANKIFPEKKVDAARAKPDEVDTRRVSDNERKPVEFDLKSAKIDNLSLRFADETQEVPREFVATGVDVEISAVGARNSFSVSPRINADDAVLSYGSILSKPQGVRLSFDGDFTIDRSNNGIVLRSGTLKIPSSEIIMRGTAAPANALDLQLRSTNIDLSALASMLPLLADQQPRGAANFDMSIRHNERSSIPLVSGGLNLDKAGAELRPELFVKSPTSIPARTLTLRELTGTVEFRGDQVETKNLIAGIGPDTLNINLRVNNVGTPQIETQVESRQLSFDPLLALNEKPVPALAGGSMNEVLFGAKYDTQSKQGSAKLEVQNLTTSKLSSQNIVFNIDSDAQKITFKPSNLSLFGGTLNVSGSIAQNQPKQTHISVSGQMFKMAEVFAAFAPQSPVKLLGTVQGLNLIADTNLEKPVPALRGELRAHILKGEIEGLNVFGAVMGKVMEIPALNAQIAKVVPEKYQPLLTASSTAFDTLDLATILNGETVTVTSLNLQHPAYNITGGGSVTHAGSADMKVQLRISQALVSDLVARERNIAMLLDKEGRLTVPVVIQRKGDSFIVLPDTAELLKNAVRGGAKDAAKKAVEKYAPGLGGAVDALDKLF